MNPGHKKRKQVPFRVLVRDFLGIYGRQTTPIVHPHFACTRSEMSGRRL